MNKHKEKIIDDINRIGMNILKVKDMLGKGGYIGKIEEYLITKLSLEITNCEDKKININEIILKKILMKCFLIKTI
jgi:hypothetical protein